MIVAALVVGLAGACASAPPTPGRVIHIEMTDYAFHPKEIRVGSGELVTFVLKNKGSEPHEIMAGRGQILHGGGYAEDLFAGIDVTLSGNMRADHSHGGFMAIADRGKTALMTFTVPARPGTYEIGCFEPGHYLAGMVGKLVIE